MKILLLHILFTALVIGNNYNSNISQYLNEQLPDFKKVNFSIVSPKSVKLDLCVIDKTRKFKVNGSYAYLPVEMNTNENENRKLLLTLKLEIYKDVLVASRPIKKNENININDFRIVEKEISALRFAPVEVSNKIDLYRAKFKISANSILQNSMVERIPDIMVGDRVEAFFNNNSVNISFSASARSEGIVGDIIKIKRDDKRIFKARIVNYNIVKIIE